MFSRAQKSDAEFLSEAVLPPRSSSLAWHRAVGMDLIPQQ